MKIKSKFLQVGFIVLDGSRQTRSKYPEYEVGIIFAIYLEESTVTAFVFFCDTSIWILYWGLVLLGLTCFSVITTLFEVAFCIFKLKDFNCSNSFILHPFLKLGY